MKKPELLINKKEVSMKPKIMVWDIETSLMLLSKFSLLPEFIGYKHIIKDFYIICASWKIIGEKGVHSVNITLDQKRYKKDSFDDYIVVKKLREELEDVDLLIHHNGDNFDLKKFNVRLAHHGLDPLPPIRTLDTLKECKKVFGFTSNRLDYLLRFFNLGSKVNMTEEDWIDILNGGEKAIKKIKKMSYYCNHDVIGLYKVYNVLNKYFRNVSYLWSNFRPDTCPHCGSNNFQSRGEKSTKTQVYKKYFCNVCRKWFRARLPIKKNNSKFTSI